jgi:hypothetical protein
MSEQELPGRDGSRVEREVGPRAWWVARLGRPEDGCAWTNKPTPLDLATIRAVAGSEVDVTELGDVAAERERCANVVRYWLAGYAPCEGTHEARCVAHVLDGRPAPVGPNVADKRHGTVLRDGSA